jgi:hypothetical protein
MTVLLAVAGALLYGFLHIPEKSVDHFIQLDRLPLIDPDYQGLLIPPNIAPLNFLINEKGSHYFVDIFVESSDSPHIRISSGNNTVQIPIRKWKNLLSLNPGKKLSVDVYIKNQAGQWDKFRSLENWIAKEKMDSHVAYRLINPGYVIWWDMGIYQRDLESFNESLIFTNRMTKRNCMNCHSFCMNNPDMMMFHMRSQNSGTMIVRNGDIQKIDTGTKYTMSPGVYPAWHPDGKHIAFSVNMINQYFHAQPGKSIYVRDKASDLIVYDIETNTITTSPKVSTRRLENLPAWSPDGKTLYFVSGTEWVLGKPYSDTKYDLLRIPYDTQTGHWGDCDTVLTAAQTGKSISFPKISPDGKFLLFCMSDYGYFTIHFSSSDLYMLDLTTHQYWKLDVNSEKSESYHSWSRNSRWIVFASKREDGLCSRLYFSHVDSLGHASKPFLLPQKDPLFYKTFVKNYNIPEFIDGPVNISHQKLAQSANRAPVKVTFDPTVDIDALSGASRIVHDR